jgi:D-tagatose-1,6-bisphosphate aldolase subunit GatZ/KbaZ
MEHPMSAILEAHDNKHRTGVYSICSAHPFVLRAAMKQALADNTPVLIESTSNQVDQFGGYTGMNPAQFVGYVHEIAEELGLPPGQLILGGDHLGPNAWSNEVAAEAMLKAEDLIRAYVLAGFRKIHLDKSMRCSDDPGDPFEPFDDEIVAERAAKLCRVAEDVFDKNPEGPAPLYVIGTEVPIPGGAQEELDELEATSSEAAGRTIEVTRDAFRRQQLESAWERVIGIVVQPGVEFGDATVVGYSSDKAKELSVHIEQYEGLVYEAHSTDYQTQSALRQMVEDHFAILKVGPALTFSFREAVFALSQVEKEYLTGIEGVTLSDLPAVLDRVMREDPRHWKKHYHGSEREKAYARKYSFSDRSRYYWPNQTVQDALRKLLSNLTQNPPPATLLSQYLPNQYLALRNGEIGDKPTDLIHHHIMEVTAHYAYACGLPTQV